MNKNEFDLVVRNARVATASDTFDADIGIKGGRIVQLGLGLPAGAREIDAAGRVITPGGVAAPLLRVVGQDASELAGPAFDPSGRRLYVSSQRGGGSGITYEITGPFRRRAR